MRLSAHVLLLAAGAGLASGQSSDRVLAMFSDGTQVEIHSEATGSTQLSSSGIIGIGPGAGKPDIVNREVVDGAKNVLFGYHLEASRGASPGTVWIRIDPFSPATALPPKLLSASPIPTVAAVREFPAVKIGGEVRLDILANPSTGEKIFDVLRVLPERAPGPLTVTTAAPRQELSLRGVTLKANGQAIQVASSWTMGKAARIDIPGHGAFVISIAEPNVPPIYAFQAVARAEGKTLRWIVDGETVEIESTTNVLTQPAAGPLWVYHDPRYRSQDVKIQTAESADWLIPKKY